MGSFFFGGGGGGGGGPTFLANCSPKTAASTRQSCKAAKLQSCKAANLRVADGSQETPGSLERQQRAQGSSDDQSLATGHVLKCAEGVSDGE